MADQGCAIDERRDFLLLAGKAEVLHVSTNKDLHTRRRPLESFRSRPALNAARAPEASFRSSALACFGRLCDESGERSDL